MWDTLLSLLVGFSAHLLGGLKVAASFIAARVLAALGLTFVNYNYVLPDIKSYLMGHATGLPSQVTDIIGALGVDVAMTMILSALVAKVGMRAFLVGIEQLQNMVGNAGG